MRNKVIDYIFKVVCSWQKKTHIYTLKANNERKNKRETTHFIHESI